MNESPDKQEWQVSRTTVVRDALVLQFKLVVDGFRDLVLVPASLIAALVSLVDGKDGKPGAQFYQLLAAGRRTEHAIDLFGALRNAPPETTGEVEDDPTIDAIVQRVESFVIDEYRRGGVTRQAKERLDQALEALNRKQP